MRQGWKFTYEGRIYRDGNRYHAALCDGYTAVFEWDGEEAVNVSPECSWYEMKKQGDGWVIRDLKNHRKHHYGSTGLLEAVEDRNGQKTRLTYHGEVLDLVEIPLGGRLHMTMREGRLVQMKDHLGRTMQYWYEDGLLSDVVHMNQGIIKKLLSKTVSQRKKLRMKKEIVRKGSIRGGYIYMEKQNIEALYASIEKEDFEKFQDIMDEVRNGKIFELSDIGKLCDVFLMKWKHIEPFQYSHIQKMILLSIKGTDKSAGLEILADKLNEIEIKDSIHVKSFLHFIFFNLSDDECMYFASLLAKQTMKESLKNEIMKLRDTKDSRMQEILEKVLQKF